MKSRRTRSCGIGIAVIGAIAALGIFLWPRERLLLQCATRRGNVEALNYDGYRREDGWLSDHEFVSEDWQPSIDRRLPPIIVFSDLTGGKTRRIPFTHWPRGTHTHLL